MQIEFMEPGARGVDLGKIQSLDRYARLRNRVRPRVTAMRARRRVALGSNLTLLFENSQTVAFQILEVLVTERIQSANRLQAELAAYSPLIVPPGYLAATLFVDRGPSEYAQLVCSSILAGGLQLRVDGRNYRASFTDVDVTESPVRYVQLATASLAATQLTSARHAALRLALPEGELLAQLSADNVQELARDLAARRVATEFSVRRTFSSA